MDRMKTPPHLLIIEARFYEDIADELFAGARERLNIEGATFDRIAVPGALEIPAALAMAVDAQEEGRSIYDAYVLLGCVIRGETTHYDIVAEESARAVMDLVIAEGLAVGNGILTVENEEQAWARARREEKNKGAFAAEAALAMIKIRQTLKGKSETA